jgi:hypothetical protein
MLVSQPKTTGKAELKNPEEALPALEDVQVHQVARPVKEVTLKILAAQVIMTTTTAVLEVDSRQTVEMAKPIAALVDLTRNVGGMTTNKSMQQDILLCLLSEASRSVLVSLAEMETRMAKTKELALAQMTQSRRYHIAMPTVDLEEGEEVVCRQVVAEVDTLVVEAVDNGAEGLGSEAGVDPLTLATTKKWKPEARAQTTTETDPSRSHCFDSCSTLICFWF